MAAHGDSQGAVDQGFFQYQGSLNHDALPASRNISLFFKVHDAELAFQPGWPHVSKVKGEVFVEETGVRILASKGQLLDTKVKDVYVNIPHAPSGKESHLLLTGGFAGGLGDGLKILQEAPIGTASTFTGWKGEGDLQGKLDLDVPLVKGIEPKIVVDFQTDKARLQLAEPPLDLTQLKGNFRFDSAKGLSGENITAQAFDRPISAQIFADGKPGNISTRVTARGQVTVKRLTEWLKISQPLPVSGDIPYQLQLNLDGADSQLMVSSNLKGVAVDLPAPFGMPASQGRDSVFRMTLQGAERRYWFDYGELANFTFAAPPDKFNDGRGELFLGDGDAVLPAAKGLRIAWGAFGARHRSVEKTGEPVCRQRSGWQCQATAKRCRLQDRQAHRFRHSVRSGQSAVGPKTRCLGLAVRQPAGQGQCDLA